MSLDPGQRSVPVLAILVFVALAAAPAVRGDISVGGEYLVVSRDLELGGAEPDVDEGNGFAAFLGFDAGNSMIYLKYSREESEVPARVPWTYERSELAVEWNWNESPSKHRYLNTSLGLFLTDYQVAPGLEAEFIGLYVGAGLTRYIHRNVFLNGRARLRLATADEDELLPSSESEETSFGGFDAQAALGFQFGRQSAWSLQVGYKIHRLEFDGRFVDDESEAAFVTLRAFVPSGGGS